MFQRFSNFTLTYVDHFYFHTFFHKTIYYLFHTYSHRSFFLPYIFSQVTSQQRPVDSNRVPDCRQLGSDVRWTVARRLLRHTPVESDAESNLRRGLFKILKSLKRSFWFWFNLFIRVSKNVFYWGNFVARGNN